MTSLSKLYCHDPECSPFSEIASCREDRTKPDENKDWTSNFVFYAKEATNEGLSWFH